MFALCALYAGWQLRAGRDRIVDGAAHQVPMVRTSTAVLEMMLEDAGGDDAAATADAMSEQAAPKQAAPDTDTDTDTDTDSDVTGRPQP